jgi:transcription initiation factor IIE alpha subunit
MGHECIEREALIQDAEDVLTFPMLDRINRQSAADVETVRHGKWTQDGGFDEDNNVYTCSACGEPWTLDAGTPADNNMHYCPNCGAKMDKEDEI